MDMYPCAELVLVGLGDGSSIKRRLGPVDKPMRIVGAQVNAAGAPAGSEPVVPVGAVPAERSCGAPYVIVTCSPRPI